MKKIMILGGGENQLPLILAAKKRGYFIFDTDNLHKLNLYHKEITPDVLLFDFDRQNQGRI